MIDIQRSSSYYIPMSTTTSAMNVSLTPELEAFARGLVKSGRYNSASEVVRTGLRLLEEQEVKTQELRGLIQEGIESGPPVAFDGERLRAMILDEAKRLRGEAA